MFIITLGVLTPIRALGNALQLFTPEAAAMFAGEGQLIVLSELGLQLLVVVGSLLAAALLIFRRKWSSVRLTIVVLWVLSALSALNALSVMWWLARTGAVSPAYLIGTMISMPLYAGIWTAYLLRSTRVANTYRRPGAVDTTVFS